MTKFTRDISDWIERTKLSGRDVMLKLGLDAHRGILLRSPVDSGRFRASNRISLNRVDATVFPELDKGEKTGAEYRDAPSGHEVSGTATALSAVKWTDTIHLTNNLPYARPLENGSSAQNGNQVDGIYGATFAELSANLAAAVASAKKTR